MSGKISQIWTNMEQVAYRAPQQYGIAATPIFTILGGPVWIKAIFGRFTIAEASGSTFAVAVNAINQQNAAVNCNGAINTLFTVPLGAAAGQVIVPALLCQPPYSLANALLGQVGQGTIASVGNIVLTIAGFVTDGAPEICVVYSKMTPSAQIVVA